MGTEARTRLALLALAGITLFSFTLLFGAADYPGPPLLGALIATGIAVFARRLGFSTIVTLLISAAALVWYLVLIFQADTTVMGIPTIDSLQGIAEQLTRAYENSITDYAPVPLRPGYIIVTVLALWLTVTVGELATFRWRRPLIASLLPLIIFSVLLVVGTGNSGPLLVALFLAALLSFWALESTHRLRSWGRWVTAFARRNEKEMPSVTGRLARRMGISCIAAALVAPSFLPALSRGVLEWRNGIGGSGDGDSGGRVDPFVSLVPGLLEQNDLELFRVTPEPGSDVHYWRLQTLMEFDGEKWVPGEPPELTLNDAYLAQNPPDQQQAVDITITNLDSDYLPAFGYPASIQPSNDSLTLPLENLRFDPFTGDLGVEGGTQYFSQYQVSAEVPDLDSADLLNDYPGPYPDSLEVPNLSPAVVKLLSEWTKKAESPFEELVAIQTKLRKFTYDESGGIAEGNSDDLLENFLTSTKAGYCQQFATAFALLARYLGYPARVVVGFLPGARAPDEQGTTYVVRGTDTHAWPEVFFVDHGWVRFEPTPRGEAGVEEPEYARATAVALHKERQGSDGLRDGGNRAPAGDNQRRDPSQGQELPRSPLLDPLDSDPVPKERIDTSWQATFAKIALFFVLVGVLFLVSVPALKRWRAARRYRRAVGARGLATAAFEEFEDEAAELAAPRLPSESATAYALRIARLRHLPEKDALDLARIYEAASYARHDPPAERVQEARRLTRELRGRLWLHSSWWHRMVRLFSPRRVERTSLR